MTIVLPGAPVPSPAVVVTTRRGTPIVTTVPVPPSPHLARIRSDYWLQKFPPGHTLNLRSLTGPYNCVGLPFASRRAEISPIHLDQILREDFYFRLSDGARALPGDLVVYIDDSSGEKNHVAVIIGISFDPRANPKYRVLSKWGSDPEFEHSEDEVPDSYGKIREYWSERV